MSLAGDILKAAAQQQRQLHDSHLAEMQERSSALAEAVRQPWRTRVEAIGQAVALVREIAAGPPAEEDA